MPTEKKAVGIWTVRMLTKLNNRVKKQSLTLPILAATVLTAIVRSEGY